MALSTSMDPFLNTSESWQSATTNSNTFYKVLSLALGLLYIIVHEKLFFLNTIEENIMHMHMKLEYVDVHVHEIYSGTIWDMNQGR